MMRNTPRVLLRLSLATVFSLSASALSAVQTQNEANELTQTKSAQSEKSISNRVADFEQSLTNLNSMAKDGGLPVLFQYERVRIASVLDRALPHLHTLAQAAEHDAVAKSNLVTILDMYGNIDKRVASMTQSGARSVREQASAASKKLSDGSVRSQNENTMAAAALHACIIRSVHPEAFGSRKVNITEMWKTSKVWQKVVAGLVAAGVVVAVGGGIYLLVRKDKKDDDVEDDKKDDDTPVVETPQPEVDPVVDPVVELTPKQKVRAAREARDAGRTAEENATGKRVRSRMRGLVNQMIAYAKAEKADADAEAFAKAVKTVSERRVEERLKYKVTTPDEYLLARFPEGWAQDYKAEIDDAVKEKLATRHATAKLVRDGRIAAEKEKEAATRAEAERVRINQARTRAAAAAANGGADEVVTLSPKSPLKLSRDERKVVGHTYGMASGLFRTHGKAKDAVRQVKTLADTTQQVDKQNAARAALFKLEKEASDPANKAAIADIMTHFHLSEETCNAETGVLIKPEVVEEAPAEPAEDPALAVTTA